MFECDRHALKFMDEAIAKSEVVGQPALQRLEALMRAYMALLASNFGARLVLSREYYLSEASRATLREGRRNLDFRARNLIQEGIADGTIVEGNPASITAAMFGAFNWVPHWRTTGDEEDYLKIADDFLVLFFNGLAK